MTWKYSVCAPCGAANRFPDLNNSVIGATLEKCPLDKFYKRIASVNLASNRLNPACDQELINLLVIEVVSSVEAYFKDILSGVVIICPISQRESNELSVSLGSALWGFSALQSRLGFEHNALSNSKLLQSALSKMRLPNGGNESLNTLLSEYDKICELRHVIAHAKGLITGKNAIAIGINKSKIAIEFKLSSLNIQDISALALALCRTFHQEIFYAIGKRWAIDWRKEIPGWDKRKANRHFKKIWMLFYSVEDNLNIPRQNVLSEIEARKKIEKEFKVSYRR